MKTIILQICVFHFKQGVPFNAHLFPSLFQYIRFKFSADKTNKMNSILGSGISIATAVFGKIINVAPFKTDAEIRA